MVFGSSKDAISVYRFYEQFSLEAEFYKDVYVQLNGQIDGKGRALTHLTVRSNSAPMIGYHLLTDRQANTGTGKHPS